MTADGSARFRLMGVVNVTPDSFSDGGRFNRAEAAVAQAWRLADEGAAFVDIGGESTRPGFTPITAAEEYARILPVIEALLPGFPVPVSVDTAKAAVAREALRRGATLINDIWGLQGDPGMADAVAEAGAGVVIMHNRGAADDRIDIAGDIEAFFTRSLALAEAAGIGRDRIILDPGIGFGKTPRQQVEAVAAIPRLRGFGLPVLVGLSRKSFLGRLTGAPVENRLVESVAAHLAAGSLGASVFRVHDVAAHAAAITVFAALTGAGP